jgi:hypothetical protein
MPVHARSANNAVSQVLSADEQAREKPVPKGISVSLAVSAVLLAFAVPAAADTFRCGSALIRVGDAQTYVRAKCGEPTSQETITEEVRAVVPRGGTNVVGTATRYIWRYSRSSRQFPAVLTFEGGKLKKLEFEK